MNSLLNKIISINNINTMNNLLNKIICSDCVEFTKGIPNNTIDLVLTSPPYDNLRNYDKQNTFNFETFKQLSKELYRVLKEGATLVWIVNDSVINGSETGTSFRQALYFKEIGFGLFDTMIYEKNGVSVPDMNRYYQAFEYMFVLVKPMEGRESRDSVEKRDNKENKKTEENREDRENREYRDSEEEKENVKNKKETKRNKQCITPKTFNPINDRKNKHTNSWGRQSHRDINGNLIQSKERTFCKEYGKRFNIWRYNTGMKCTTNDNIAYLHPALMPEKLAEDHILSWSNENDIIFDPFMGSGTTAKMCLKHNRNYIGCDISEEYCNIAKERVKIMQTKIDEERKKQEEERRRLEEEPYLFINF
jgi:site-specific DNA-methyltransferase (adenine-specific)